MNEWEQRIKYPDGIIASYQQGPNYRYFKLTAKTAQREITSGVIIEGLGYNGNTPGPLIIVEHGDWILLEVVNETDEPNALHVHGLVKPNTQDGMPEIEPTPRIEPGQSYTYRFQAAQVGTFFYHSSSPKQIAQGLLGPFVVVPKLSQNVHNFLPSKDYIMFLQQWQVPQPKDNDIEPGTYKITEFDRNPNFFTINGRAFPNTSPIRTTFGEKIRIRFINKSSASHTMHTHGHDFTVVMVNGFPRTRWYDDTINIASGQRVDIELISNNPGRWPINGTKTFHQTNNGKSPGGMITSLIYN